MSSLFFFFLNWLNFVHQRITVVESYLKFGKVVYKKPQDEV